MGLFSKRRILYTPGPLAEKRLPHVVAATKRVLKDLGVEFVTFPIMSGFEAWFAGHEAAFQELMRKNKALLAKERIRLIITNDPHEAYTYRERYGLDARHVIEIAREHQEKIVKGEERRASYHHPCFLDRLGVTPTMVKGVLRRAGVHVAHENPSRGCCGSVGHDFERNNPEEAAATAKRRRAELPEKLLITCCPHCLTSWRRHAKDVMELLAEESE